MDRPATIRAHPPQKARRMGHPQVLRDVACNRKFWRPAGREFGSADADYGGEAAAVRTALQRVLGFEIVR
jgi:hypothetical protein